jgi:hypothetical protein
LLQLFYVWLVNGETEVGSAGEQPIRDAFDGSTKYLSAGHVTMAR